MRKVLPFVVGLAVLSAAPAKAEPVLFSAILQGTNENPVNASPGLGFALIGYDATAHTLSVLAGFDDLLAGVTAAHIHCCTTPPANVGVATTTPTFPGFPSAVTTGFYSQIFDLTLATSFNPAFIAANGGTPLAAELVLAAGMASGQSYFNIHSTMFPGGEIRGFLAQVSDDAVIPEPATLLLVGGGIGALAAARRRRLARR
jgi:CHRD domain/PEP-CTERM motif